LFPKENYVVENYILHYNENNPDEVYSDYTKTTMANSSIILLVLSDQYLINEWNNQKFRDHLRYLVMRERTRFVCIQLHDICDEEVEDYFRRQLQIPRFVALENDEFMFWPKLHYHLYTNDSYKSVMPTAANKYRDNDSIDFDRHSISRPIIHLDGCRDPYSVNMPDVSVLKTVVLPDNTLCENHYTDRSAAKPPRPVRKLSNAAAGNNSDCECLSDREAYQRHDASCVHHGGGRMLANADFEFAHSQQNTHRSVNFHENEAELALVFTNKAFSSGDRNNRGGDCGDSDSC
jgi:hypothetical protein